jgi:uncharacterized protein (TIGR03086 family)
MLFDMTPISDYQLASTQISALLADLEETDLARPTPCGDWNVGALAAHLVGNTAFFAGAGGQVVDDDGTGVGAADAGSRFEHAATAVIEGFSEPGRLDAEVATPFGAFPGSMVLAVAFADLLTHYWDLGQALDLTVEVEPPVAERALETLGLFIQDDYRANGMFGPVQPCPADASALDRLAAFSGRQLPG